MWCVSIFTIPVYVHMYLVNLLYHHCMCSETIADLLDIETTVGYKRTAALVDQCVMKLFFVCSSISKLR
jgi:hypothetical protein